MRRERRPSSWLRGLLLFVLGGLVGANATYFLMSRDAAPSAGDTAINRIEVPLPATSNPPAQSIGPMLPPPAVRSTGTGPATMPPTDGSALLIPVQGITVAQLQDTFSDARSGGRVHDAIDIMAPAGTPVLAVADGSVEKLFESKLGGTTLYQFNPQRTLAYYYAHLQAYVPGIAEKQQLKRGQVIGYVGATGNANPDGPHLHFAIFELGPEQQWWKGTAINPYPRLRGDAAKQAE